MAALTRRINLVFYNDAIVYGQPMSKVNQAKELGRALRGEFPVFRPEERHRAYLDTAASSQKPRCVIERLSTYLSFEHANIHRGAYALSAHATELYDQARGKVGNFLGAKNPRSIIFTRGTTESINLVAHAFERFFAAGDTILLSLLEHHSNIVPWQLLAQRKGLQLAFVDVLPSGELNRDDLSKKLKTLKPKLLAITHISNALGTVVPVAEIIAEAHEQGCKVLVDAAQSVAHYNLRVEELDADFLAFSGHKLYGPTGIGVLYGKLKLLSEMDPFLGGGDMIRSVAVTGSTWAEPPERFEAGTPPIAEAIALGTAIDFISELGLGRIKEHEDVLTQQAFERLSHEPGVTLYGPMTVGRDQASIISFNVKGVHAHDFSTVADSFNVQLRAGHHCAMPLLQHLKIGTSARISFGVYSCKEDIDPLLDAIRHAQKMFQ